MSFLYPAFLVGGLAIVLPIVLHLLRRDVAPEVPFTAVRLLQRSPVERPARRRLRELLLLVARVAALLLLAAAFARPYVQGATPSPIRVVAIDRSYSMGGPDRFARVIGNARAAVDATPRGERVALIAFDDRAEVLAPPGGVADARAALGGIAVGAGATRYDSVFAKSLELAGGARGHLVIVTDLQRGGWDGPSTANLPAGWSMDVQDVGSVPSNVAVTTVAVENERVVATIRNDSDAATTGRARVSLDGREVAQASYSVLPRASAAVPIVWRAPESGALAVSIEDATGLEADNTRYVALGPRGNARILVVTSGGQSGLYLARALATSTGDERGLEAEIVSGGRLGELSADRMSSYPAVALLSTRGIERGARETLAAFVRHGGGLLLAAGPDLDISIVSALADWQPSWSARLDGSDSAPVTLAATDLRHPIFRPFGALAANLGQVRIDRAWRTSPDGWSIIARFSNGSPALLERTLGEGRVVLFASDIDRRWNDFPLHPSFVPFALETARYVAGADRHRVREYTVAQAPSGVSQTPGTHRTGDGRLVAVNVDPREGELERMTREAFAEMVQRSSQTAAAAMDQQARQTESRQSYWQYGLLIMLAALVAESFVGRA